METGETGGEPEGSQRVVVAVEVLEHTAQLGVAQLLDVDLDLARLPHDVPQLDLQLLVFFPQLLDLVQILDVLVEQVFFLFRALLQFGLQTGYFRLVDLIVFAAGQARLFLIETFDPLG